MGYHPKPTGILGTGAKLADPLDSSLLRLLLASLKNPLGSSALGRCGYGGEGVRLRLLQPGPAAVIAMQDDDSLGEGPTR